MHIAPASSRLAEVLPGRWIVRASNLVQWLSGERIDAIVSYEVSTTEPLELVEHVRFTTPDDKHRVIKARARLTPGGFVVRGTGLGWFRSARWSVVGINAEGNVMVVRHGNAQTAADGIEIFVRESIVRDEVRAAIAHDPSTFRLSLEDFASLTWFPVPTHR